MSPQRSNRQVLIEGTLRCLERLPAERVTTRVIAEESGANLASIAYHFGSKDELLTEAVITGLDRWLAEITSAMREESEADPTNRLVQAAAVIDRTRTAHAGLAKAFLRALPRALDDERLRQRFVEGFQTTHLAVAALLDAGDDQPGTDAAQLAVAMFNGLLFQSLVSTDLVLEGQRLHQAHTRLREILPEQADGR